MPQQDQSSKLLSDVKAGLELLGVSANSPLGETWDLNRPSLSKIRMPNGNLLDSITYPPKDLNSKPLSIVDSVNSLNIVCGDKQSIGCSVEGFGVILPHPNDYNQTIIPKIRSGDLKILPEGMIRDAINVNNEQIVKRVYSCLARHESAHLNKGSSELGAYIDEIICLGLEPDLDRILRAIFRETYDIPSLARCIAERVLLDEKFEPKPFCPGGNELSSAFKERLQNLTATVENYNWSDSDKSVISSDIEKLKVLSRSNLSWDSKLGEVFIEGLYNQVLKSCLTNVDPSLRASLETISRSNTNDHFDESAIQKFLLNHENEEEKMLLKSFFDGFLVKLKTVFSKCGVPTKYTNPLDVIMQ